MIGILDKPLHKWLKVNYKLTPVIDKGSGQTVILLHGIGKSNTVWQHVIESFKPYHNYRIVAYDLLGFGSSPKPDWLDYDIDDHTSAVIKSLDKLKAEKPFIIIAHSMGCLIAVRLARRRPDLVKHLVLYEMPLYEGLPEERLYKLRLNVYRRFYTWVINYQPGFDEELKKAQKLARKIIGFEVTKDTWIPFIKSLENTILKQTAAADIRHIDTPMDVIYGTLDMLVVRGHVQKVLSASENPIRHHKVRARHVISKRASDLIVERVVAQPL